MVLFHHAEGVNCLCVSDLMCYVLILMLVNLGLWSEDGSKSIQQSGWIQVQWQTLCIIPEVFEAFSIDLWWMCKFVHLSDL